MDNQAYISKEIEFQLSLVHTAQVMKDFCVSPVGRYLLERASEAEESAFKEFGTVDPEDPKQVRQVQENARIPKLVFAWLQDAIVDGNKAAEAITELEDLENEQ